MVQRMMKKATGNQTVRAGARIGLGVAIASLILDWKTPGFGDVEVWRWLITAGVNESAYVLKSQLSKSR